MKRKMQNAIDTLTENEKTLAFIFGSKDDLCPLLSKVTKTSRLNDNHKRCFWLKYKSGLKFVGLTFEKHLT